MKKKNKFRLLIKHRAWFIFLFGVVILSILFGVLTYQNKKGADFNNPQVDVMPLVRSAYFQFNLSQFPGLPTSFFDPNTTPDPLKPIVEIPKVHQAFLLWKAHDESDPVNICDIPDDNWKKAQDFERVQGSLGGAVDFDVPAYSDPRMATMLLGLVENNAYDYKITFSGGGFPTNPVCGQFSTKSTDISHTDTESVLTLNKSSTNITAAVDSYLSDGNYPSNVTGKHIQFTGDPGGAKTIIRGLGDYFDRWKHISGNEVPSVNASANNWLVIEGKQGDNVVLDGSDPQFDTPTPGKWLKCGSGTTCNYSGGAIADNLNIYKIATQYYNPSSDGETGNPIDQNGLRLKPLFMYYEKENGGDPERLLQNDSFNTMVSRVNSHPYEATFTDDQGYVYVHLNDGQDPNIMYMKIPIYKPPFAFMGSSYITFRNLTFQYFRTGQTDIDAGPVGIIGFSGSHNLTFNNLNFKGTGTGIGPATQAYRSPIMFPAYPQNKNIIVKDSNFISGFVPVYDSSTHTWKGYDWNTVKPSNEASPHISFSGFGVSILNSNFIGGHDGITPPCAKTTENNYGILPDDSIPDYSDGSSCTTKYDLGWEVDNNYFKGIQDDAVEMRVATVGMAVTRNKFDDVFKDISLAPIVGGPYFIARNVSVQSGASAQYGYPSASKLGNKNYATDTGYKLIANNTFINTNANYNYNQQMMEGFGQEGRTFNLNVFNNIMISDNSPIQLQFDNAACYPQIFDNNLYIATRHDIDFIAVATDFAMVASCAFQGDTLAGNDARASHTFQDWQQGNNTRNGQIDWPNTPYDVTYHSTQFPWVHDLHGWFKAYYQNPTSGQEQAPADLNFTSFNMSEPANVTSVLSGDFRPKAGNEAINLGRDLANITYDVGPGWATASSGHTGSDINYVDYSWPAINEPTSNVTAGAIPAATNEGNITIDTSQMYKKAYQDKSLTLQPIITNASGFQWAKASGPDGGTTTFGTSTASTSTITFNNVPGTYYISVTATDESNHTATRTIPISVHKTGDIDGKNGVNSDDFFILLSDWGSTPNNRMSDIDGINGVNSDDFFLLLSKWG